MMLITGDDDGGVGRKHLQQYPDHGDGDATKCLAGSDAT